MVNLTNIVVFLALFLIVGGLALGLLAVVFPATVGGLGLLSIAGGLIGFTVTVFLLNMVKGLRKFIPHDSLEMPVVRGLLLVGVLVVVFGSSFQVPASIGGGEGITGLITPAATTTETGVTSTECIVVNPDIIGETVSITVSAVDLAASNPTAIRTADSGTIRYYKNAPTLAEASTSSVVSSRDSTSGSVSGFSVGDVISIAGESNASFFVEPMEGICINERGKDVTIKVHQLAAVSNWNTTLYDDTVTELTADSQIGNTACGDYSQAFVAGGDVIIIAELKANTANRDIVLQAIATAAFNDIDRVSFEGQDVFLKDSAVDREVIHEDFREPGIFRSVEEPDFLHNIPVAMNQTGVAGASNITTSYEVWKMDNPLILQDFDKIRVRLKVQPDNTNNPADDTTCGTSTDAYAVLWLDGSWAPTDALGKPVIDIHDHTDSEADVGINNEESLPQGLSDGALVIAT